MSTDQLLSQLNVLLSSLENNDIKLAALPILEQLRGEIASLESDLEIARERATYLEYDLRCAENS